MEEAVGEGSAVVAGNLQLHLFRLDDIVSEGAGHLQAADGTVLPVYRTQTYLVSRVQDLSLLQPLSLFPLFPQLAFLVCVFSVFFLVRTHNEVGAFGRFMF